MDLISINGKISPPYISITDRGVLFGESLYEVIPVYNSHPFNLHKHLVRLKNSFQELYDYTLCTEKLTQWILQYIEATPKKPFRGVYIQMTSGSSSVRRHITQSIEPTCVIHDTFIESSDKRNEKIGYRSILIPDTRSSLARYKTTQLSLNTRALNAAKKSGYHDAIFHRDNLITEAACSNFFAVINDVLCTPPLINIVPGITRETTLQLAKDAGIPTKVQPISIHDLQSASEIFLSSSIKILKPIIEVQNCFTANQPGPIWHHLLSQYKQKINESIPVTC